MVKKAQDSPIEKKADRTSPVEHPPEGVGKESQPPVREGNADGGPKEAPGFTTGDASPEKTG